MTRAGHPVGTLGAVGVILTATLGMAGCSLLRVDTPAPGRPGATASEAPTVAAVLARAGYVGTPMRRDRDGGRRFVQAAIGATPVDLLLDSDAPFDLSLDPSLTLDERSGVRLTHVLSAYWTGTTSKGYWARVDRLTMGGSILGALEAKVEPAPSTMERAVLGAAALVERGAVIDYDTDTLYLPAVHDTPSPAPRTAAQQTQHATLRATLERAGRYRTFLALMRQAGLSPLLDGAAAPVGAAAADGVAADSIAWVGLRIAAAQRSGVGSMPPNDVHLQLARQTVDRWRRGPGRLTVFAPTDAAFAGLPADTLAALRADTARLARLLRAHLFPGAAIDTATMRTLIRGAAQPGPGRPAFGFHVLGPRIEVDRLTSWEEGRVVARAGIVEPDLRTAHGIAVAHGIDRVLGAFAAQSPLATALARQGYVGVPLYRREDGAGYFVRATINGVPVQLTIDTGTPTELRLDRESAGRLSASRGDGYVVALDSVRVGAADVEIADLGRSMQAVRTLGYRTGDGIVGSSFLAKHHVRLDYGAGVLYLRAPSFRSPEAAP